MTVTLYCVPRGRMQGSRNRRVKVGVSPLTITPSDLLRVAVLLLPAKSNQGSRGPFPHRSNTSTRGDTRVPLNFKLQLPPSHFELLIPKVHQPRKGVIILAEIIDPAHQQEVGLLLHKRDREECVWHRGDPLVGFLVSPAFFDDKRQLQHTWISNISGMTRGSSLTT